MQYSTISLTLSASGKSGKFFASFVMLWQSSLIPSFWLLSVLRPVQAAIGMSLPCPWHHRTADNTQMDIDFLRIRFDHRKGTSLRRLECTWGRIVMLGLFWT